MKLFLIVSFLSIAFVTVQAQQPVTDSLKHELRKAETDSEKVKAYMALADAYQYHYLDTSLLFSLKGYSLAAKSNNVNAQIMLFCIMEEAYAVKGDFRNSLQSALKSLHLSEKTGDSALIGLSNNAIGMAYFNAGDYQTALDYYFKTTENTRVSQYLPSEIVSGLIGRAYYYLNKPDSSLYYLWRAFKKKRPWPVPYTFTGAILEKENRYEETLGYYCNGIKYSSLFIDKIVAFNGISGLFEKMGQTDSAVYYAKQVVTAAKLTSLTPQIVDAAGLLTKIYIGKHIVDSAFMYQNILMAARDSLFSQEKVRRFQGLSFSEEKRQQDLVNAELEYRNKLRMYILAAGLIVFFLIAIGLIWNIRNKRKANEILHWKNKEIETQRDDLKIALSKLKSTQSQLIQSEKMASLGELTAGIAHEIQNPLNFVNNFSDINMELIEELRIKNEKLSGSQEEAGDVKDLLNDIESNEEKINHHGKRGDGIVKSMLEHSRTSTGVKEPTDINKLADEYLRLAYHGMRAKDKSFNCTLETHFDETLEKINVIPQDIGRVLLNLFNNAFYACAERKSLERKNLGGLKNLQGLEPYVPTVTVVTRKENDHVTITVRDNKNGIPEKIKGKIFQPFFTTKPTGSGTGLGLSLSYDIITKEHGGTIKVESEEGVGTEFTISLLQ